tara:strand:- start:90 stop:239 length:150 start_codon:yes stop_codon:yes gene_type:complete
MKEIKMPIWYCEMGKLNWKEMARELENRISEVLDKEVSITIEDEGFIEL